MTEGQILYFISLLIYLSECFLWIRRRTVLFTIPWCCRWKVVKFNQLTGNENGSFVILNPFLPLGNTFSASYEPVSISPFGICDFNLHVAGSDYRSLQSGNFIFFDQIKEVKNIERFIYINGSLFTKFDNIAQAERLTKHLNTLRSESIEKREKISRENLEAELSIENMTAKYEPIKNAINEIRLSGMFLFSYIFIIVPVLVQFFGLNRLLVPTIIMMIFMAIFISIQYFIAHKQLYPLKLSDRIINITKMILCPPVAIRASDLLTINAFSDYNPTAIGAFLLGPKAKNFILTWIKDLQFPISHVHSNIETCSIAEWYAQVQIEYLLALAKTEFQIKPEEIFSAPAWDGLSHSYCPRCDIQINMNSVECPDCPGITLKAFITKKSN